MLGHRVLYPYVGALVLYVLHLLLGSVNSPRVSLFPRTAGFKCNTSTPNCWFASQRVIPCTGLGVQDHHVLYPYVGMLVLSKCYAPYVEELVYYVLLFPYIGVLAHPVLLPPTWPSK